MTRKFTIAAFVVLLMAAQAFALSSENLTFTFGGGFNSFQNETGRYIRLDYGHLYYWVYENEHAINHGYNIYGEGLYEINNNVSLGAGIQYMFASSQGNDGYLTFQDDYDNRKPPSEEYYRDIDFIVPYLVFKNEFKLFEAGWYTKLSVGLGYGISKFYISRYGSITERDIFVASIIPGIGTTIISNKKWGLNIETGYRFIKTSEMNDNLFINDDNTEIDFSGWFFQTGISFSL